MVTQTTSERHVAATPAARESVTEANHAPTLGAVSRWSGQLLTNQESDEPGGSSDDDRLSTPWFVDLDHTLVKTDTLWESLLVILRRSPWSLIALLPTLLRGKSAFKNAVAQHATISPEHLPYCDPLLQQIRDDRRHGRTIILATAAHSSIAEGVARHLGVFDDVLASSSKRNLRSSEKLAAINDYCHGKPFDYAGDSPADLPIIERARSTTLVSSDASLQRRASAVGTVERIFVPSRGHWLKHTARAIRVHQWAKNVLLAVPLLTSHRFSDLVSVQWTLLAMLCFSLVASGQYVANDLLDLEADRQHPKKRNRPFAAGDLSIPFGLGLAPTLILGGFLLAALTLPGEFLAWLAAYLTASVAYSVILKQVRVVDVLMLAGLFTLRVMAGGAAIGVTVSVWLLAFSLCLFTSLALLKRYIEASASSDKKKIARRGYTSADASGLATCGQIAGYLTVVVFSLYITSDAVTALYDSPSLLWFGCPLLVFWIARVWRLAKQGGFHHDPVVFALTDVPSYLLGGLMAVAILIAM